MALEQEIERAQRAGPGIAVLFIDLDGFNQVNDQHGHQAGDVILQRTAERLAATVRAGDHVGRLGGDEFLAIARLTNGPDDAVALGDRLLAALSKPIEIGALTLTVAASIGIAVPDGRGLTPDETLREADLALYRAKRDGRNRVARAGGPHLQSSAT